jgi:hypothetical protein
MCVTYLRVYRMSEFFRSQYLPPAYPAFSSPPSFQIRFLEPNFHLSKATTLDTGFEGRCFSYFGIVEGY